MDTVYELSNEDREENQRYWQREKMGGGSAEAPPEGEMGGFGGESPEIGGGDVGGQSAPEPPTTDTETPPPTEGGDTGEFEF